jgi:hypothetical protein
MVQGVLDPMGFISPKPARWSKAWLALWGAVVPLLLIAAFTIPVAQFVGAVVVLFLMPELISLKQGDSLPPLTQTIRHFLPGWLAFPLIYGLLGAFGAKTLGFGRWWGVGVMFGLLGWLTEHFTFTYLEGDPRPGEDAVTPKTAAKKRLKL